MLRPIIKPFNRSFCVDMNREICGSRPAFWLVFFCTIYTLRGHEWHFLMKTMPEASGASSRWLRSVSDDTTERQRDIRSFTPAGMPAAFFLDLMTGRCRFAQPPATCFFDASGIILIRCIMCDLYNYNSLAPTQGFAPGYLGPGLWPLNQYPLKYRRFMVLQDVRNNKLPSPGVFFYSM